MSLRSKVFLLFGALLAILLGSQWFMMRSITQDVSRELGQVAFSVGRDTASFFILGNYQWNDQFLLDSLVKDSINHKQISNNITVKSVDGKVSSSVKQEFVIFRPPAVEIRLNNQIEDDFLELITSQGTQSIPIPRDGMIKTVNMLESRMLSGTLVILVFGLIIAAYFSHRLSAPLRDLSQAAESVAKGELGTTISQKEQFISSEIKSTVESFNHMSKQLADVEQLKARVRENDHYKELGEISRGLAHSVRNPLNTLGLSIEELSRNDLQTERRASLVDSAARQISRIDHWVRSFMTFSLSGDTKTSEIKIMPLIKDIQLEASQLEQTSIKFLIKVDCESEENLRITGVEAEIKAILHALIINAVEASPEFGTVTINISETEAQLKFEIQDQGKGIPIEIRNNLFQPHQTTKARGSGMGLFMAHRLTMGRYHGSILVKDGEKVGTTVELELSKNRVV